MKKKYVIFGGIDSVDNQPMFYIRNFGWGSLSTANVYTEEEKEKIDEELPTYNSSTESVWVQLPE